MQKKRVDSSLDQYIKEPKYYDVIVTGMAPVTMTYRVFVHSKEEALALVERRSPLAKLQKHDVDLKRFKPNKISVKNLFKNTINLVKNYI